MDHFDFAFVGSGLSGLVRAGSLLDQMDQNQRVVIIDPHSESLKSKTFASWVKKSDPPHEFSHLVAQRWDFLRITGTDGAVVKKCLGDFRYECLPGEKLYEYLSARIDGDPRVFRLSLEVRGIHDSMRDSSDRACAVISPSSGPAVSASHTFISPLKKSPSLLQSFTGLEIKTTIDYFDPQTLDLMDFRVPQDNEVRFVYILPFSPRHALVEFTVFSNWLLSPEKREAILIDYLKNILHIESFSITRKEDGIIPMNIDAEPLFAPSFKKSALEVIGGASGMIKPSTGYSLKRILDPHKKTRHSKYSALRFRFYDGLMIDLMQTHGGQFAEIFFQLFKRNSASSIFEFLDERSTLRQEIRIFASLPKLPFILKMIRRYPFFFAAVATLLLDLTVGGLSVWIIPVLGFFTVGIGHGSIDHLINPDNDARSIFYVKYLGSMLLFLLLWNSFPGLAFVFFIFQSASHFGESYWIRALCRSGRDKRVSVLVWLWGLFAATFGVLFHWHDSLPIIQKVVNNSDFFVSITNNFMRGLSLVLFSIAAVASRILDKYQLRATGRLGQGFPATLLLGLSSLSLPLLPGFFCFFSFWHSMDSVRQQRALSGWNGLTYTKKALPFTLVTNAFLVLCFLIFARVADTHVMWKIVFVGIGALTAAHSPLMTKFLSQDPGKKMQSPSRDTQSTSKRVLHSPC